MNPPSVPGELQLDTNSYDADTELNRVVRERDELVARLAELEAAMSVLPGCDTPRSPQDLMDVSARLAELEAREARADKLWETLNKIIKALTIPHPDPEVDAIQSQAVREGTDVLTSTAKT